MLHVMCVFLDNHFHFVAVDTCNTCMSSYLHKSLLSMLTVAIFCVWLDVSRLYKVFTAFPTSKVYWRRSKYILRKNLPFNTAVLFYKFLLAGGKQNLDQGLRKYTFSPSIQSHSVACEQTYMYILQKCFHFHCFFFRP